MKILLDFQLITMMKYIPISFIYTFRNFELCVILNICDWDRLFLKLDDGVEHS